MRIYSGACALRPPVHIRLRKFNKVVLQPEAAPYLPHVYVKTTKQQRYNLWLTGKIRSSLPVYYQDTQRTEHTPSKITTRSFHIPDHGRVQNPAAIPVSPKQVMEEPLYDQLRTKEQLGYSVGCSPRATSGVLGFCVTAQSAAYGPAHLYDRIRAFMRSFRDALVGGGGVA